MNDFNYPKPILGIAAFSGTGKTELLKQLIPTLKAAGIQVAVIKHAHHKIDIDKPGKDSYEVRQAGANPVLIASDHHIALMIEREEEQELQLEELVHYINPDAIDLLLIEGFKELDYKKLFLFRHEIKGRFQKIDSAVLEIMQHHNTLAIVTDIEPEKINTRIERQKIILDINNIDSIKQFVIDYINDNV